MVCLNETLSIINATTCLSVIKETVFGFLNLAPCPPPSSNCSIFWDVVKNCTDLATSKSNYTLSTNETQQIVDRCNITDYYSCFPTPPPSTTVTTAPRSSADYISTPSNYTTTVTSEIFSNFTNTSLSTLISTLSQSSSEIETTSLTKIGVNVSEITPTVTPHVALPIVECSPSDVTCVSAVTVVMFVAAICVTVLFIYLYKTHKLHFPRLKKPKWFSRLSKRPSFIQKLSNFSIRKVKPSDILDGHRRTNSKNSTKDIPLEVMGTNGVETSKNKLVKRGDNEKPKTKTQKF